MTKASNMIDCNDPFDLHRFTMAQDSVYDDVLRELRSGQKRTHWIWYIFPQIDGLAYSTNSKHYAIKSLDETRQYLNHPVLGRRLVECVEAVLAIEGRSILEILGSPDDMKLKSSMTLLSLVANSPSIFNCAIDKYYGGKTDDRTVDIISNLSGKTA